MTLLDRFEKCGIVPVVVIDKIEDAKPLAKALLDGNIDIAEVTFRTSCAGEAIEQISKAYPEMLVGAGTVLTIDQLEAAYKAGAKFIVSPGFDCQIVKRSKELGLPIFPGAVTPTEIINALNENLNIIKFFPAGNYGGLKTLKALSGPFTNVKFIPTGGVNNDNLEDFIKFDKIIAVGGSWVCPAKLVNEGNFKEITRLSKQASDIVKKYR